MFPGNPLLETLIMFPDNPLLETFDDDILPDDNLRLLDWQLSTESLALVTLFTGV
ncbi:hypothetical protein Hanom_Chr04g00300021 [Helianthus anomalus]